MPAKSKVEISQNFVAFSEYMNFTAVTKSTTFPSCLASASCYIYEPLQSAFLALEIAITCPSTEMGVDSSCSVSIILNSCHSRHTRHVLLPIVVQIPTLLSFAMA